MMTMSLNDYLAQEGVLSPFSDFMLDKLRIPHGLTARGWERLQKEAEKARITYAEKRQQAIREYNALLASGEIQAPSKLQRLLATANVIPIMPLHRHPEGCYVKEGLTGKREKT